MTYRNTVTGAVIVTSGTVRGGSWEPVSNTDTPPGAAPAETTQTAAPKPKRRVKKQDGQLCND